MTRLSQIYHFDEKFAENRLCQTWRASLLPSGASCVVKFAVADTGSEAERCNRFLSDSYRLQRQLHCSGILKARRCQNEGGVAYVEYPYLNSAIWTQLTPSLFVRHIAEILPQICLTVDYLHVQGLVHSDLKLENFLFDANFHRLMLLDLDFLCRDGSALDAMVLGTRDHIAPEVELESILTVQSDNYSLGVSLKKFLEKAVPGSDSDASAREITEKLRGSLDTLLQQDYIKRPRILLDFLSSGQILPADQLVQAERRLLNVTLMSRLRNINHRLLGDTNRLDEFLHQSCHLFGLFPDAVALMSEAFKVSRVGTVDAAARLIEQSELTRHSDFWHIRPSLETLSEFYDALEHFSSPTVPSGGQYPRSSTELLEQARRLAKENRPERALLLYDKLLKSDLLVGLGSIEPDVEFAVPFEAGIQAQYCGRNQWALDLFQQSLGHAKAGSEPRARAVRELVSTLGRLGKREEALQHVVEALDEPWSDQAREQLLWIRRQRAWNRMIASEYEAAWAELQEVMAEARKSQFWELEALSQYGLAMVDFGQGKRDAALSRLLEAQNMCQRHGLDRGMLVVSLMLAQIYAELCEYPKAVSVAKSALESASVTYHSEVIAGLCTVLVGAYNRLGRFSEAVYWHERALRTRLGPISPEGLQLHWSMGSILLAREGDYAGALQALRRAFELGRVRSYMVYVRTCMVAQHVYRDMGKLELGRAMLEESRRELTQINDQGGLVELDLEEILLRAQTETEGLAGEIPAVVVKLLHYGCRTFATLGLMQLLLLDEARGRELLKKLEPPALSFMPESGYPLMTAVHKLAEFFGHDLSFAERVGAWKQAFTTLNGYHSYFWAGQVAVRLGELYLAEGLSKHSRKFFKKGLELANRIPNPHLAKKARLGLEMAEQAVGDNSGLITSYVAISEILKDVSDFRGSLNRLIRFAVDQTGAERGVLLLKQAESPGLQVGAAVNCDDQSLADVVQFSSRLPESAFKDALPIIVEDATSDERTRDYKSVVIHNILSVACLPLADGGKTIGVLYLDHHSIPALFAVEDVRYIESVANFITVFLTMAQEVRRLNSSRTELLADLNRLGIGERFVTQDPVVMRLLEQLPQIAKTNASVLLVGESGTGKELLCNMIQGLSLRAKRPFRKLNCASIAASMIESELFGVAKSAFTGVAGREGRLETADDGTLFLDEIGDMPLDLQAKILRVIEYQEFERVGSTDPIRVDIRYIYATNKDIRKLVAEKRFREDLLYRINTITIEVPPLRSRIADIPLLIDHYVRVFSAGRTPPQFSAAAMDKLLGYPWPGNARELRNVVERTCILYPGQRIDPAMLPREIASGKSNPLSVQDVAERAEATAIREALIQAKGVQLKAAKLLNMPLSTLRRKIQKYGITLD
jgi:transcriptional regulator with GAF, ATPase, and Fis domain/serine/threonine protein kinase